MQISKEIIEAFFAHQCTPEEAQKVSDYLNANPDELEKYLPVAEWDSADVKSLLPETFWKKQWERIKPENRRSKVVVMMKRVAVAAILILAIGTSVFYFTQKPVTPPATIVQAHDDFKTITNNNSTNQLVHLSDGSDVELLPNATITYKDGFEATSRDIVLEGEAVFSVAKDKSRPFTVYSGNISTTALGTKFRVTHWGDGAKTQVHLYEGKVVVKSTNAKNKKETQLLPGDLLSYSNNIINVTKNQTELATKTTKERKEAEVDVENTKKVDEVKSINKNATGAAVIPQWYRFDKESLANVFDQLAALYNVKIEYNAEVLQNKYFIGKFEQNKTIDKILKTIAELNHLQVEKIDDDHYKIK